MRPSRPHLRRCIHVPARQLAFSRHPDHVHSQMSFLYILVAVRPVKRRTVRMTTVYWKNERMLSAVVRVRKWMTAAVEVRKWMSAVVEVRK